MNKQLGLSFEEVATDFTPFVTSMIKRQRIYKNKEEFLRIGYIAAKYNVASTTVKSWRKSSLAKFRRTLSLVNQ